MIRNNFGDWSSESLDYMDINVTASTVSPTDLISEEEIVERARRELRVSIPIFGQLIQGNWTLSKPQNVINRPIQNPNSGSLITQATSFSHFNLSKSDAIVTTLDPASAPYWSFVSHTLWQITNNPRDRLESLNMDQVVANKNGTYTLVLSAADPGVHNWLKGMDEGQGIIVTRFQGLPVSDEDGGAQVEIWSQVIPLKKLAKVLPEGTKHVTKSQRAAQLKERAKGYDHIRKF